MNRKMRMLAVGAALSLVATGAQAAPKIARATLDALARDVDRAESVRAVKDLQRTYAQYSQFGLWHEMASLFADDGTLTFAGRTLTGRAAIEASSSGQHGEGKQGLPPGALHTQLIEEPLVNLAADGRTAKARWYGLFFLGDGKAQASITGGVYENAYVRQGGVWKIASSTFTPQYTGPYDTGWINWQGKDLANIPFHFTADETGIPIAVPIGPPPHGNATLGELDRRAQALVDTDKVRNLQAAYGYYVDRRMWDDVVDLFADDGAVEIAGIGRYRGKDGVRRALEPMGPADLTHGILNDRPQFDTVVTVAPGGREAHARGIELAMIGDADHGTARWEMTVFDNRFVKEGGLWKLRELRLYPLLKSDYYQGWAKSRIVDPAPTGRLAPDLPARKANGGGDDRLIPAFLGPNPVTGLPVEIPAGYRLGATMPLTAPIAAPAATGAASAREIVRKLAVAKAYDGAENVSTAYGVYLDDFQWPQMGTIFGKRGAKQVPFAGYYLGADRIAKALLTEWGPPPTAPRAGISFHWRIQPVILVAPDGRSATVHTRLFQPRTSKEQSKPGMFLGASFWSGIYNDQMVLEDGIWRIWNLTLDEPIFESTDWKGGWSAVKDRPAGTKPRPNPVIAKFPPDIPITALGAREEHFRGGTGETVTWPGILPMWFDYTNPVTGRVPPHLQRDCAPCDHAPDLRMTAHGYTLPPIDPVPEG